jgi:hypothetical protein
MGQIRPFASVEPHASFTLNGDILHDNQVADSGQLRTPALQKIVGDILRLSQTQAPLLRTFPDHNLSIDLSAERLTNNVRNRYALLAKATEP